MVFNVGRLPPGNHPRSAGLSPTRAPPPLLGLRVWGPGFRVQGSGSRVWVALLRVVGLVLRVESFHGFQVCLLNSCSRLVPRFVSGSFVQGWFVQDGFSDRLYRMCLRLTSKGVQTGRLPGGAEEQLLRINVKRFREGFVFETRRLLYHSTLGSRVIYKKKKRRTGTASRGPRRSGSNCRNKENFYTTASTSPVKIVLCSKFHRRNVVK